MSITRQPENFLYNDNAYQLPGPAPVLATAPDETSDPESPPGDLGSSGSSHPHGSPGDAKSPREWLLFVVWRQKWLIAATVILAGMAAWAYLIHATPLYTSTARVYVQPINLSIAPNGGAEGGLTAPNNANYLNTQREVVTSEPVLAIASTFKDVLQTEEMRDVKDPILHLKSIVAADVDKSSDLLMVSAFSPSGEDAAAIANGVVTAYKNFQTRSANNISSSTGDTLGVLEQKKGDVEAAIQAKLANLHEMEVKWGVLSRQDDRSNIIFRRLQALSEALTNAQAEAIDAKMAYDEASLTIASRPAAHPGQPARVTAPDVDDQDIPITTAAELNVLRSEMLQTQTQLQELQQRYMPEHPRVLWYKNLLGGLRVRYVAAIQRRYLSAQARVEDLQQKCNEEQKRAVELDSHAADYARLQEEVNKDKGVRDSYEAKMRDIQLTRDAGGLNIEVLESARVSPKPSWPNRTKTMAVALAVGLSLGLLFACMREWVDDRFRSAGEIKSSLGMPLLAVIPQSTTKRSPSVSGQRILLDPGSDTAEAYRSLRAAVLYSAPEGQLRTLLVTSPSSGDGKTTLVSNLAIAMAQGGRKVLIVDADLRNPSQHDIFGVKNNTGLSALLAGRCSLETAVQRSHVANLEILPCGPTPANPAEILNSREFGETLETLADKYDCVVLDSPPVEAVADARIIAASCDATLIVLKAQTAHRRTTEHTRDSLTSVGARVLGVVVNDLPRRNTGAYGKSTSASRRYVPGLTNHHDQDVLPTKAK